MEMVHPRSASYCKPRFWILDLRGWKSVQENLLIPALVRSGMETFLWHAESTDWLAGFQSSLSEPQFPKAQQSSCDYLLCSKRIARGAGQYATATRYFWFCWPLCRNFGNRKASCFRGVCPRPTSPSSGHGDHRSKTVEAQKRFNHLSCFGIVPHSSTLSYQRVRLEAVILCTFCLLSQNAKQRSAGLPD